MFTGVPLSCVARNTLAPGMESPETGGLGEGSASSSSRMPRAAAPVRSAAGALDLLQCGIL